MKKKLSLILAMILTAAFLLAGCTQAGAIDGTAVVGTLDDTIHMTLGELNLILRYEQAQAETLYSMFGSNIFLQDMGDGRLYGEITRDSWMDQFEEMYVLEAEAPNYGVELTGEEKTAITEAAKQFISDNSHKTKKVLGVTQETVERVLTLRTIRVKMYDLLTADVDTVVSDEEAAQKRIEYVFQSNMGSETQEDGSVAKLTGEELEMARKDLELMIAEAEESGDFEAAAEARSLYATETTYGVNSTTPAEEVRAAADELGDGEYSGIIEVDTGFYVVHMISTFDEEATENEKVRIVEERAEALFDEKYAALAEGHTFTADEELVATLGFDRTYIQATE